MPLIEENRHARDLYPKKPGQDASSDDWTDYWIRRARISEILLRNAVELIYRFHVTDDGTGLHDAAASFLARMNRGRK